MPGFTPILEEFLGNPLEAETGLGRGFDDFTLDLLGSGSSSSNPSDSDTFFLADEDKKPHRAHPQAVDVAITSSDALSAAAGVPSISVSSTDIVSATSAGSAAAVGPAPSDTNASSVADTVSSLNVTVSDSDAVSLDETPTVVASNVAINDTDSATLTEAGTNSSGGGSVSYEGIVIAFGNNALDASPTWTRIDDPAGVS